MIFSHAFNLIQIFTVLLERGGIGGQWALWLQKTNFARTTLDLHILSTEKAWFNSKRLKGLRTKKIVCTITNYVQ